MIIAGAELGALHEISIIAAVLSIQDPRIRPADKIQQAQQAQQQFIQPGSDILTFVNIWNSCKKAMAGSHPSAGLRKFCKTNFCSWQRMREWFDIHDQILRTIKQHKGFTLNTEPASASAVHQALTAGFLRNIGMRKKKNIYQISGNREAVLFPGSSLYNRGGQWIVAADFVHTSQLFARVVTNIDVNWLESLGGDLCKRSWSDPHWQKKAGQVMALEKVSLFGLILTAGRRVNYGRINKQTALEAREIFIHQALINGELSGNYPFLQHNLDLIRRFADMEERLRRRGIMMDDQVLYEFYDQRLGRVYDRFTLNRFLKKKKSDRFLWMAEEDICRAAPESDELYRFPDSLQTGQGELTLHYRFQPGHEEDGVTVDIPVQYYSALSPALFEWLVPGLLEEKIFFLLKGLPKRLRKLFVPLPDAVDRIMDGLDLYHDSLYPVLEQIILRRFQVTLTRADWQLDNLPPHLRMRFRLCDEKGKILHSSRSFYDLEAYCLPNTTPTATSKRQFKLPEREEITSWDFTPAPQPVSRVDGRNRITTIYYPILIINEEKQWLSLQYTTDQKQARQANRTGLGYLYSRQFSHEMKAVKKECKAAVAGHSASWLSLGMKARAAEIKETLVTCVVNGLFDISSGDLPDKEQFASTVDVLTKQGLLKKARTIINQILDLLAARRQVRATLTQCRQRAVGSKNGDANRFAAFEQLLKELMPPDFLLTVKTEELADKKRYLQALTLRIERAEHSPAKDEQKAKRIQPALHRLQQIKAYKNRSALCHEEIALYRRMVEEFRISVFAPELGTAFPISEKRLNRQWQNLENGCRTME
jgi:ATP-dependent helicase HrpA